MYNIIIPSQTLKGFFFKFNSRYHRLWCSLTLVANIALQHIKTVEAAALNQNYIICENGLVKILMIINLGIVTLMAFAKL